MSRLMTGGQHVPFYLFADKAGRPTKLVQAFVTEGQEVRGRGAPRPDPLGPTWWETKQVTLRWTDEANPEREPGIEVMHSGWGYAGWDPERLIYWRYVDDVGDRAGPGRRSCMRVEKILV